MLKERQFTLLNLVGLSTGLACTLLIYLWLNDELHVDHYNERQEQLYLVMANHPGEGGIKTINHTAGLLVNSLKAEMPKVEKVVTVVPASWFGNKGIVSIGDAHIKAGGQFTSKDFFNVFTCPVVDGDVSTLLEITRR